MRGAAMPDLILSTKGLMKSYPMGAGKEITVLEDINMEIMEGEFVSILGPSGAGKSTLLRILAGLAVASGGTVFYHEVPFEKARPKIAMVFQSFALFPWLTVLENTSLGLKSSGIADDAAREKAIKMLDIVGLDGFEDAYPRELSGGMRQRVGIARALVVEPEVLLMDEPFSGLDVLTADHLRSDLIDFWTEKKMPIKSIILVTHNIEEAVEMSDRAIVLSHNPARIKADVKITAPHPRDSNAKEFKFIVDRIYSILTGPAEKIPFLLEQERYQFLPHTKVGAVAGLLELVFDKGGKVDIPALTAELSMEVDDIFPLIEAAVFLGLGETKNGDFIITNKGRTFSQADTLEKKVIFQDMALNNIQLVKQIYQVLLSVGKHRISEDFFIEILENHFTTDEAWNQLEIAIDWGRYAELFAYDYDTGDLYLETHEHQQQNEHDPGI
jgi:NitT/TauT family transport system ATP-binding protein